MGIGLVNYLTLAAIVFTIGIAGIILNHKNIIIILMSVELILLVGEHQSRRLLHPFGRFDGQVFALFILTVAAAEAAMASRSSWPTTAIAAQSRLRTSIR